MTKTLDAAQHLRKAHTKLSEACAALDRSSDALRSTVFQENVRQAYDRLGIVIAAFPARDSTGAASRAVSSHCVPPGRSEAHGLRIARKGRASSAYLAALKGRT